MMPFSRRELLAGALSVRAAGRQPVALSAEHLRALHRRRRVVVQYDAYSHLGGDFRQWLDYRFNFADEKGTHIDSLWWDLGAGDFAVYPSTVLPRFEDPGLVRWWNAGIDWVRALVEETRKRNLEVFWNHRVNEVDVKPTGGLQMEVRTPQKAAHPDWVIRCWWWQGLWNLAVPGVRQYQLSILRELAQNYDLDGIQLDFARHVPHLPPGRQWELRAHCTEFVRMVRVMLLDVEKKRRRPFLLAAKVPETLEGCRMDGFDVETWAQQNMVDIFTLGSRTMTVDLAAFRRITAGKNINLQPCLDDHHATDGYRYPPIEFFRGVFGNWWQQGADGVSTFNWSNASPEVAAKVGAPSGPRSHQQAYLEGGSPRSLRFKDKIFAVERRGGYPWAEGYFNRNDFAALPAVLANDGRPVKLAIRVCDNVRADAERVKQVNVTAVLFGATAGDRFEMELNGVALEAPMYDHEWKDPQIFSPRPQPASGGRGDYKVDPKQKLLRLLFQAQQRQFRLGENQVRLRIVDRVPYLPGGNIQVEKVEVELKYTSTA